MTCNDPDYSKNDPIEDDFASAQITSQFSDNHPRTSIDSFEELENYAKTICGSIRIGDNIFVIFKIRAKKVYNVGNRVCVICFFGQRCKKLVF